MFFASLLLILGCAFCSCAALVLALKQAVWIPCWIQGSFEVCEIIRLSSWILHHLSVPNESTDGKDGFLCGRTECSMNRFGWVFTTKWAYVMLKGYRPTLSISPDGFGFKPVKTRHWFSSPYTRKGTVHILIRYLYTYMHNKLVLCSETS